MDGLCQIWVHLPISKVGHSTNAVSHWIATKVGIQGCARHQGCAAPPQLLETANIIVCPESIGSFSWLFDIFSPHSVLSLSTLCCFVPKTVTHSIFCELQEV